MKILHISDLHYSKSKLDKKKYKTFITKLLEKIVYEKNIDFIFFTGDIVNSGNIYSDFFEAKEMFIDPLIKATNIKDYNLFLCAGNHDVDRSEDMEAIQNYFSKKLRNNNELDKFVNDNKNKKQYESSCDLLKNYISFSNSFYSTHVTKFDDIIQPLFTTHIREEINGIRIGIVTLNSAWRAFNDAVYGNLYFPPIFFPLLVLSTNSNYLLVLCCVMSSPKGCFALTLNTRIQALLVYG